MPTFYGYYDWLENWYEDPYKGGYYFSPYYYPDEATDRMEKFGIDPDTAWVDDGNNGTMWAYDYRYPYNLDTISWVLFPVIVIVAIFSTMIALWTAWMIYKHWLETPKAAVVFTASTMLAHMLVAQVYIVVYFLWYVKYQHQTKGENKVEWHWLFAWEGFWFLSRLTLYLLFLYRYYCVYLGYADFSTSWKYSKCGKRALFGSLLFMLLVAIIVGCLALWQYYRNWRAGGDFIDPAHMKLWLALEWTYFWIDIGMVTVLTTMLITDIVSLIASMGLSHDLAQLEMSVNPSIDSGSGTATAATTTAVPATSPRAVHSTSTSVSTTRKKKDSHQLRLLYTTTKVLLTTFVPLATSSLYYIIWLLVEENQSKGHWLALVWYLESWVVDTCINMVCVYLSMGFADAQYKMICVKGCRCHRALLRCLTCCVDAKVRRLKNQQEELEQGQEMPPTTTLENRDTDHDNTTIAEL